MATAKQVAARERNWKIHQLRGIYAMIGQLGYTTPELAMQVTTIRIAVDRCLEYMEAESETQKRRRFRQKSHIQGVSADHYILDDIP